MSKTFPSARDRSSFKYSAWAHTSGMAEPDGFPKYRPTGFAIVCHQRPERSFWIFGDEMAVCSRCLGIYLGAAAGMLFRTSRRIALRLLIAAVALNLFDAMTELAALHGNSLGIRFVFGLLLGAGGRVAGFICSRKPGRSDRSG